jgi:hypothetical protein
MDFLRRLFGGGSGSGAGGDNALYLYVKCGKCGSPLRVRVDPRNELSPEFDESEGVSGYLLRKEMMDSKCFRLMYATLRFDARRREIGREVEGGEFISAEEYARLSEPAAISS